MDTDTLGQPKQPVADKIQGNCLHAPVSVVIPCYRCADTIERAVHSAIHQTLPPAEIILIDDFSNDGGVTINALEQQRQANPSINIKICPLPRNVGPGSARNAGWDESRQPYLAFLDADDSWHPHKLKIQYQWMATHPEAMLSGHLSVKMSDNSTPPGLPDKLMVRRVNKYALLLSNCFPTRSVMLRRDVPFRFKPEKRYAEDYLVWLAMVFADYPAYVINQPLAYSYKEDFGEGGLTADIWKTQLGECDTYRQLYNAGSISTATLILVFGWACIKYVRRYLLVKWRSLVNKYTQNSRRLSA